MAIYWAVNGSKFSAEAARAETFKNTNGARGVTLPPDLKVTALPTPGPFVRVAPGAATLPAGYPGAPGQSYSVTITEAVDVPVPATTSAGGAQRFLIFRLRDPQYEGSAPADPVNHEYGQFEWVSNYTFINAPYVQLAKLIQPPSTATITQGMLTDIRRLTKPRKDRLPYLITGPANGDLLQTVAPAFQKWPAFAPTFEVPEWANYVNVIGRVHGSVIMNGVCHGNLRCDFGNNGELPSGLVAYDFNTPSYPTDGVRNPTLTVGFDGPIPLAMRGTTQKVQMMGNRINSTGGYLRADVASQIEWDVQFEERIGWP